MYVLRVTGVQGAAAPNRRFDGGSPSRKELKFNFPSNALFNKLADDNKVMNLMYS